MGSGASKKNNKNKSQVKETTPAKEEKLPEKEVSVHSNDEKDDKTDGDNVNESPDDEETTQTTDKKKPPLKKQISWQVPPDEEEPKEEEKVEKVEENNESKEDEQEEKQFFKVEGSGARTEVGQHIISIINSGAFQAQLASEKLEESKEKPKEESQTDNNKDAAKKESTIENSKDAANKEKKKKKKLKKDKKKKDKKQAYDRLLMVILSADEYAGRMYETDESIVELSMNADKASQKVTIQELLGLRGHLQDELLRIETMLSADDPKLKCLNQFKDDYSDVVNELKALRTKKAIVKAKVVQEELPPNLGNSSTLNKGSLKESVVQDIMKKIHDQEERQIAENYASRLVNKQNISEEYVAKLLKDHALSMQALRRRQDEQKGTMDDKMKAKLQSRLDKKRKSHAGHSSDETDSEDEEVLRDTIWNKMELTDVIKPEHIKEMVQIYTRQDSFELEPDETKDDPLELLDEDFKATLGENPDLPEEDVRQLLAMYREMQERLRNDMLSKKSHHDAKMQEKLNQRLNNKKEDTKEKDEEFVQNFLEVQRKGVSMDDITALMEQHLSDKKELRDIRKSEREKLNEKLQKRLQKSDKFKHDATEEGPRKIDGVDSGDDDDFFEKLQRMQAKGQLNKEQFSAMMKEYMKKKDMEKKRRRESKVDIEAANQLILDYKQQKQSFIEQRKMEKMKRDEKLNQLLKEKTAVKE